MTAHLARRSHPCSHVICRISPTIILHFRNWPILPRTCATARPQLAKAAGRPVSRIRIPRRAQRSSFLVYRQLDSSLIGLNLDWSDMSLNIGRSGNQLDSDSSTASSSANTRWRVLATGAHCSVTPRPLARGQAGQATPMRVYSLCALQLPTTPKPYTRIGCISGIAH
jgi:hypothetical protein